MDGIISKLESELDLMEASKEQIRADSDKQLLESNDENGEEYSIVGDYNEIENVYFAFIDVLGFSKIFGAGAKDKVSAQ